MSGWPEFRMPPQTCPACGAKHDAATCATGKDKPDPGDLSICIRCGSALQFGPDFELLLLSRLELLALPAEVQEQISIVQAAQTKVVLDPRRPR